jgi:hypothetical protein
MITDDYRNIGLRKAFLDIIKNLLSDVDCEKSDIKIIYKLEDSSNNPYPSSSVCISPSYANIKKITITFGKIFDGSNDSPNICMIEFDNLLSNIRYDFYTSLCFEENIIQMKYILLESLKVFNNLSVFITQQVTSLNEKLESLNLLDIKTDLDLNKKLANMRLNTIKLK